MACPQDERYPDSACRSPFMQAKEIDMLRHRAIVILFTVLALSGLSTREAGSQTLPWFDAPDGAWFGMAHMADGTTVPYLDIYTSHPGTLGRAGAVFCTLAIPAFDTPFGRLALTQGAHGSWVRAGRTRFTFTAWRILVDADPSNQVPDGAPIGMARFKGTMTVTGSETFVGTMNVEYFGPDQRPFLAMAFTTSGSRIAVEQQ
jgi:hypothetical protein